LTEAGHRCEARVGVEKEDAIGDATAEESKPPGSLKD